MKAEIQTFCNNCQSDQLHSIAAEVRKDIPSIISVKEFGENQYDISGFYQIIKCGSCDFYSYRSYAEVYNCPVIEDDEVVTYQTATSEHYYPEAQTQTHRLVKKFDKMPQKLYGIYSQLIASHNEGLNKSTAMMLRTVIELSCEDIIASRQLAGEPNPKLERKIELLKTAGYLPEDFTRLLHAIRKKGNSANHTYWEPETSDLTKYIDQVEGVLAHLFNIKFEM